MSMFTICAAFIAEGKLQESTSELTSLEKNFTREIGVLFRRFFQCKTQPHIIWSITEWESAKHHHDAAQSLMKQRRDDRFASILFGPDPYFSAQILTLKSSAGRRRNLELVSYLMILAS